MPDLNALSAWKGKSTAFCLVRIAIVCPALSNGKLPKITVLFVMHI